MTQARNLCIQGLSILKIADIVGCGKSSIDRWCRDIYVQKSQERKQIKRKARKMYLQGMNSKEVGKQLGYSSGNIQIWCKNIMRNGSECRLGNKNPAWRNGVSPIIHNVRESYKYKEWRNTIFVRDNWTCQECGQYGGHLNVEHKKHFQ